MFKNPERNVVVERWNAELSNKLLTTLWYVYIYSFGIFRRYRSCKNNPFNKFKKKNQTEIDRENAVTMLQIYHVRFISEGTFHAKSNALFDDYAMVHH